MATPGFADQFVGKELKINDKSKSQGNIAIAMQNMLTQYKETSLLRSAASMSDMEESISTFRESFGEVFPEFANQRQQCAHEFLSCLL